MPIESHRIDASIQGADFQFIEIELDPGEKLIAERGAMLYTEDGIKFKARLGDGSAIPSKSLIKRLYGATLGNILGSVRRAIVKESIFLVHFVNEDKYKRRLALTAARPGQIIELNLKDLGGEILAEKEAFLCAAAGTRLGISFRRKLSTGLFGGEGFIMQKISGDGKAFLHIYGTTVEKELKGNMILVDTGCLVAYQPDRINFTVTPAGGPATMAFAGEGIFLAKLQGHGKVWLQSQPRPRKKTNKQPTGNRTANARRRRK